MDSLPPDKLRSGGLANGPSTRRNVGSHGIGDGTTTTKDHLSAVIIIKDDNGYGMKVSGDNPVYVQSVKPGGAAEKAGLHKGDVIIKVNGVNVMNRTHTEVVDLIKAANQVVLTVQQEPPWERSGSNAAMHSPSLQRQLTLHTIHQSSRDMITAPQPVDHEKLRQLEYQRAHTLKLMLEKEQRFADSLRSKLAKVTDSVAEAKLQLDLVGAERRVHTLVTQLEHEGMEPPPLPSRNRRSGGPPLSPPPPIRLPSSPPPPLPPRQYLLHNQSGGGSSSSSNGGGGGSCSSPPSIHHEFLASQQGCGSPPGGNPQVHTHHRTKSSPDSLITSSFAEASKRLIASESMSELPANHAFAKRSRAGGIAWEVCEEDDSGVGRGNRRPGSPSTPPGTPPPPYHRSSTSPPDLDDTYCHIPDEDVLSGGEMSSERTDGSPSKSASNLDLACATTGQTTGEPIITMEEDMSDQEMSQLEDHGPFKSLSKLWNHQAHLAVFLNYIISNSNPASLLFYLVTDLYKEGSAKEMKKWAYEIHSSFLVPGAPLRLNNVGENIVREIDDVLLKESDKEEILRKIFWKARQKAKDELQHQLRDFQAKRTAGLGTLYGPIDNELEESVHDKAKENKIIESVLVPKIESYIADIERGAFDDQWFTTGAALGTVMGKFFGIKGTHFNSLLERCPTYVSKDVSKDKSFKARFTGKTRKVTTRGHHWVAHQYYLVTYCNHCQLIIWGIGPQGYKCTNCWLNIHRNCVNIFEENCPGPMIKKEKGNDRISRIMDRIRPENPRRKQSSLNPAQVERAKRLQEEAETVDHDTGERGGGGGKNSGSAAGSGGGSCTSTVGAGRPDPVREGELTTQYHDHGTDHSNHLHDLSQHVPKTKPGGASINRSESYKERIHQKRQLRERRKTSDPNLSKTNNEVEVDAPELSYKSNSGSSSNSSLSTRSVESENNSVGDALVGSGGIGANATPGSGAGSGPGGTNATWDSDMEAEPDPADWTASVPEEVSKLLSARERKRQEVINEIFYTEKSHVRGLKVLQQVFHRPMRDQQVLPADQIQLLFSNLDEMLSFHSRMNQAMKAKRKEASVVGAVGQILVDQFDGPHGEAFKKASATFCARQQIALEALKERRKKDPKLNNFLNEAEMNPICRRLQLKDIISKGWIRLTKYPLLFESLAKYTAEEDKEEAAKIQIAIERSKELLNQVDAAVKEAEDSHRLAEIQRRLDKTLFDKAEHPIAQEFRNLDLTKHKLIHEGSLLWRMGNRQKTVELHVLLLDDSIILLQKQDEKFVLKFYSPTLSPVIKVSSLLVRHNAVDKKALFLVNTSHNGAQIYDLVASSSSEKRKWFKHLSEAAEAYKQREGRHRRPEPGSTDLDASTDPVSRDGENGHSTDANETLSPPSSSRMNSTGGSATSPASSIPQPGSPPVIIGGGAESTPTRSTSTPAGSTTPTGSPQHSHSDSSSQPQDYPPHVATFTAESTLIDPTEVVVSTRDVHTAEPVLTPLERLRRKDEAVRQALCEKQALVADILHVPREEFENIAELVAADNSDDKEPSELVLAAVNKAHELSLIVNEALRLSEEEAVAGSCGEGATGVSKLVRLPQVPAYKLQGLATSLTSHLTQLLNIMTERDEERERLRRELQRSREQLHAMHEKYDNGPSALSIGASPGKSSPANGNTEDKSVLSDSLEADDSNPPAALEGFADANSGAELDSSTITTTSSTEDDKN